jgi:hypothetical protein
MKLHRWDLQEDNTMPSCSPNTFAGKHHKSLTTVSPRKLEKKLFFPELKIIRVSNQNSLSSS